MNNTNVVNDTPQAVVEPAQDAAVNSDIAPETSGESVTSDPATRKQSKSENSNFAKMRKELAQKDQETQKLLAGLGNLGIKGSTQEILEQLEAQKRNITVDELREENKKIHDAVKNNPEYQAMAQQLIEHGKREDLRVIQQLDESVQSLDELGEEFYKLRAAGVSPVVAYNAVKQSQVKPKLPDNIGPVNNSGNAESEFFTSEQLDRLTPKDLENESIFKKAMRSLKRL